MLFQDEIKIYEEYYSALSHIAIKTGNTIGADGLIKEMSIWVNKFRNNIEHLIIQTIYSNISVIFLLNEDLDQSLEWHQKLLNEFGIKY